MRGMSIPAARALLIAAAILGAASPIRAEDRPAAPLLVPDRVKSDTVVVLAHPDDEGVVAPLLAREALAGKRRVVAIYLTAGEAGVDRVSAIRGPAFGTMRLTELHWTLDRLGVAMFHVLFRADLPPAADPAAVVTAWDRDRTVRELTRHLRLLRPDRLLTWLPGPASAHGAHIATGALALLAVRAAASSVEYPEQLANEGLRVWRVPETAVFFQADKVSYPAYPIDDGGLEASGVRVEIERVDAYDAGLGRRYADVAREAMREQRSVAAAAGLDRGGSFDAPLKLVHLFEERPAPGTEPLAAIGISFAVSTGQRFFEATTSEIGAPGLLRAFDPEVAIDAAGGTMTVTCAAADALRVDGTVSLSVPEGWSAAPASRLLALDPHASTELLFEVKPSPSGTYGRVEIRVMSRGRASKLLASAAAVLKVTGPSR
ncbi:MAG: PIG-L family deacetylase [Acidobacteria bacterium]|nr:PIG-L family deacetylase [Acidobacteriota bacterium]